MSPIDFRRLFLEVTNSSPKGWWWSHGGCFHYAYCFIHLVGGSAHSYLTHRQQYKAYGHCFIKYNGKFYDSENKQGQESWKKLQPYMLRAQDSKKVIHSNSSAICKRWGISETEEAHLSKIIKKIQVQYNKEQKNPHLKQVVKNKDSWVIP